MKATSISTHEASFHTTPKDSSGKQFVLTPITVKIKNSTETITLIDTVRENKDKSFYFEEETEKRKIILHFTMGYLKGDIAKLTHEHVSVPYVVGRNGNIYNLFASKFWSYHLGPGTMGGNTPMSKECIGIEISNIGPLLLSGTNLVTTYGKDDVYCSLDDTQFYTKLKTKYRGYEYFASYTDAQYKTVLQLIKFLCAKYDLPKNTLAEAVRYNIMTATDFTKFKGILSHVNCRTDKVDIGPAFDWARVISSI
jgi:N-acetylmuramoyl-L-alanine amidase